LTVFEHNLHTDIVLTRSHWRSIDQHRSAVAGAAERCWGE